MRVLGIDPGYGTMGFGVVDGDKLKVTAVDYGVVMTPSTLSFPKRLQVIERSIKELTEKYSPDAIAVEELFFQTNKKTAISVAEARGVILLAAINYTDRLYEYTPMQIKQALTGYGKADKRQIQEMVRLQLRLKSIPKPDDAADALAVAITHVQASALGVLFKIN